MNKGQTVLSNAFLGSTVTEMFNTNALGLNIDTLGENQTMYASVPLNISDQRSLQIKAILNTLKTNKNLFDLVITALANHNNTSEYIDKLGSLYGKSVTT